MIVSRTKLINSSIVLYGRFRFPWNVGLGWVSPGICAAERDRGGGECILGRDLFFIIFIMLFNKNAVDFLNVFR